MDIMNQGLKIQKRIKAGLYVAAVYILFIGVIVVIV